MFKEEEEGSSASWKKVGCIEAEGIGFFGCGLKILKTMKEEKSKKDGREEIENDG